MINQLLRNQNAAATASLGKPIETFLGSLILNHYKYIVIMTIVYHSIRLCTSIVIINFKTKSKYNT